MRSAGVGTGAVVTNPVWLSDPDDLDVEFFSLVGVGAAQQNLETFWRA